jgi:1-acyl-sn-glycerol-3-phosphate acyltransferase
MTSRLLGATGSASANLDPYASRELRLLFISQNCPDGASGTHQMTARSLLARLWYSVLWCPCWAIAVLWFRFRSTGRENVPATGPVLLVSNHQSHLDPVLVGIACPRQMRFLARHTLFFWPLSWLIRSLGAVPIDRERGGLGGIKATLQLLKLNEAVLAFPEGSRSKDGRLQSLLPGFCALARRSGATVVPVAIDGAFAAMPRGSRFPHPRKIVLAFCPTISQSDYVNLSDAQIADLTARRIAVALGQIRPQP